MKKIVVTLNISNYNPVIRSLTYPLMKQYARKIRADFAEITERKYPDWPIVMEKFQVADIARGYDWSIFVDADALISPEFFDITAHLDKRQVCFNGKDMAGVRSYPDKYFLRDGRNIGACNWWCVSSDWNRDDLYAFPEFALEDVVGTDRSGRPTGNPSAIYPTINERNSGLFQDHHLIDDYTLSRNIARYGLAHTTNIDICQSLGFRIPQTGAGHNPFLFHLYALTEEEKLNRMLDHLSRPAEQGGWAYMKPEEVAWFREEAKAGRLPMQAETSAVRDLVAAK